MAPPVLRDYQQDCIDRLRASIARSKRSILQAPTGAGKSVMIAHMIGEAQRRNKTAWLICHRKELLDQLSDTLWQAGVHHGVIMSGRTQTRAMVQVASIQTLVRRLDKVEPPDLVAIDECHHATASSYRKTLEACPGSFVVGLTATPSRTDGAGLGDIFNDIVEGPPVADLIRRGYLSPYRIIAPGEPLDVSSVHMRGGDYARGELEVVVDKKAVIGDAVEHYQKYVAPKSCLVYCVSRMHARHVTEGYRDAGVDARYVAGDTEKSERDRVIAGFRRGTIPVIVSVDLFGEGLDCPGLTAVQLLRPTQSLGLHLQQIGRALRVEKGKDHAIILDHVGNTWRHGLPDDEREWSLEGRARKKRTEPDDEALPDIRHCEKCFAVFRAALECPQCGHKIEVKTRQAAPDEVDGELREVDPEEHRRLRASSLTPEQRQRRRKEGMCKTFEDWVALAVDRGYSVGWAGRRFLMRQGNKSPSRSELAPLKKQEIAIRDKAQPEKKPKVWSYTAGTHGSKVRVYTRSGRGETIYMSVWRHGKEKKRSLGHSDREMAMEQAEIEAQYRASSPI